MKTADEIQKAHDMLVAIILGDVPMPLNDDEIAALKANVGVLCWLLDHDHNPVFADNLRNIEAWLKAHATETDMGKPVSRLN